MKTFNSFVSVLSEANAEYAKVFDNALEKWKVSDPSELSDEEKKKFFNYVDSSYESDAEKQGVEESYTEDEDCQDCGVCENCSAMYAQQVAQHPEEDMTESRKPRFYTKTFPAKHFEYYDWRESSDSAFYVSPETTYAPVDNSAVVEPEEDVSDYQDDLLLGSEEPTYWDEYADTEEIIDDGLEDEELYPTELEESCAYASPEPDSALGASLSGDKPAKRIDVIKDINRTAPDNNKPTYRLWLQYASGQSVFIPEPHQSGVINISELESLSAGMLPQDREGVAAAIQHMLAKELAMNPARTAIANSTITESAYSIHHPTYTSAINAAIKMAQSKGFDVSEDEFFHNVSVGPAKPKAGKTNKLTLQLTKNGVPVKKWLQIQVYGMDHGTFELNTYIG